MVGVCPPIPIEKCRSCRLNHPCPIHRPEDRPDYMSLAKKKRWQKTGKRKDKKRAKKRTHKLP